MTRPTNKAAARAKASADGRPLRRATDTPPWHGANPRVKVAYPLRMSEATHIKLAWLKQHLPNTSIQQIIMQATEERVEQLLLMHYYRNYH